MCTWHCGELSSCPVMLNTDNFSHISVITLLASGPSLKRALHCCTRSIERKGTGRTVVCQGLGACASTGNWRWCRCCTGQGTPLPGTLSPPSQPTSCNYV